jgi:hypothetical protein
MPLGWALAASAGISAVGSWLGGREAAKGAESAANVQAQAAQQALDWQKEVYGDIKPYLMQSLSGYSQLLGLPPPQTDPYNGIVGKIRRSVFERGQPRTTPDQTTTSTLSPEEYVKQTPGYLFRLNEGLRAVGIPQGGRQLSGPQIKRAVQFGQDYATNEYQNALARIAGLGSLAQGVYGAGQQYATSAGNIVMGGAQAQAQGITGAANARAAGYLGVGNAINQGIGQYTLYNMFQNLNRPTTTGVGSSAGYYGGGYVPPGGSFGNTGIYTAQGAEGTGFSTY